MCYKCKCKANTCMFPPRPRGADGHQNIRGPPFSSQTPPQAPKLGFITPCFSLSFDYPKYTFCFLNLISLIF